MYLCSLFLLANLILTRSAIVFRAFLRSAQVDNRILQRFLVIGPGNALSFEGLLKFVILRSLLRQFILNSSEFLLQGLRLGLYEKR